MPCWQTIYPSARRKGASLPISTSPQKMTYLHLSMSSQSSALPRLPSLTPPFGPVTNFPDWGSTVRHRAGH